MKVPIDFLQINSNLRIVLPAILLIVLSACSQKVSFQQSSVVPAAQGTIKVKKDKNSNYAIDIDVVHLASPDRLQPAKKTYVVWMETKDNSTKNIGQLSSSGSLLSKALKGSLKTVTSFNPLRFFITAEDDASIQYPGMQVILTSEKLKN